MGDVQPPEKPAPRIKLPPRIVPQSSKRTTQNADAKKDSSETTTRLQLIALPPPVPSSTQAVPIETIKAPDVRQAEPAKKEPDSDPRAASLVFTKGDNQSSEGTGNTGSNLVPGVMLACGAGLFIIFLLVVASLRPEAEERNSVRQEQVTLEAPKGPVIIPRLNAVEPQKPLPDENRQTSGAANGSFERSTPPTPAVNLITPRPIASLPHSRPQNATPLPSPRSEAGRSIVWRGLTYHVLGSQISTFNAIKSAGVKKLAEIKKLDAQIDDLAYQISKARFSTKERLLRQRDALSLLRSQAVEDYTRIASDMDQFTAALR